MLVEYKCSYLVGLQWDYFDYILQYPPGMRESSRRFIPINGAPKYILHKPLKHFLPPVQLYVYVLLDIAVLS